MKYILMCVALVGIGISKPLTLNQMSKVWLVDGYNFQDFAIRAKDYKRLPPSIAWGLLGNVWIPFPPQTYFNGNSSGTIEVTTFFDVHESLLYPKTRLIKSVIVTAFTAQPIPSWPTDPNQVEPEVIIDPVFVPDPNDIIKMNDLITLVEAEINADPNNVGELYWLLEAFKNLVAERKAE